MSIDRDDCDERQARLDWMIDEFRKAQARRLLRANDKAVESQVATNKNKKAAVTRSVTSE